MRILHLKWWHHRSPSWLCTLLAPPVLQAHLSLCQYGTIRRGNLPIPLQAIVISHAPGNPHRNNNDARIHNHHSGSSRRSNLNQVGKSCNPACHRNSSRSNLFQRGNHRNRSGHRNGNRDALLGSTSAISMLKL